MRSSKTIVRQIIRDWVDRLPDDVMDEIVPGREAQLRRALVTHSFPVHILTRRRIFSPPADEVVLCQSLMDTDGSDQ